MKKIIPMHLQLKDTIGIVSVSAPEAALEPEWFERGVKALNDYGFKTKLSENVKNKNGYLSNKVELLANDLNSLFGDEKINAIICAGGGINSNGLLNYIDFKLIEDNPKIIMGMSNPSIILNAIHSKTGLITFHGPAVIWNFGNPNGLTEYTRSHLWPIITDPNKIINFTPKPKWKWFRGGSAKGNLVGGNLISIQGLLGTPYAPEWQNSIFFWEDIGKTPDRIHMMLTHFKDAGVFDAISGMVVGELVNCNSDDLETDIYTVLEDVVGDYSFPILCNVDFGHTDDKITLPIGCTAKLDSKNNEFSTLEVSVI